ncbi:MAG TPA: hypothetical protein VL154_12895 [Acetobacteraceae bacterium]|jgi:ElaB/YqjD/DUF883 family membrane-anchored ribosome-binding protein|nr:hypothetical protein [Acetobacteraceae bacterium]
MATDVETTEKDIRTQLDELRAQIASLLNDRVAPKLAEVRDEAEAVVRQARDAASCQAAAMSREIRERPFTAVLVAAVVGALIGRLSR